MASSHPWQHSPVFAQSGGQDQSSHIEDPNSAEGLKRERGCPRLFLHVQLDSGLSHMIFERWFRATYRARREPIRLRLDC